MLDALHQTLFLAAPSLAGMASATLGVGDAEHGTLGLSNGLVMAIVGLPMLAFVLNAMFAAMRVKTKLPAFVTVACLALAFVCTAATFFTANGHGWSGGEGHGVSFQVVQAFRWLDIKTSDTSSFVANFSFYMDSLSVLWMLFVTGLATLIALYASEYMSHDVGAGYNRFFAAFSLFVVSMACLVMADNLVLLYLGWEGVGLCSYLLIGYFYKKPSAVAAAKKAFIVNRIGDLFLALGIMLTFVHFGSVEYSVIFEKAAVYIEALKAGRLGDIPTIVKIIPLLFIGGAFGKSAQLPLYVWLPDAMEGPTPVSALIHAATMVTAGVYLIARMFPLFLLSETALPIVAWIGALTALFSATIGMAQFDIKRIMAYSTVSQLGYMFAGLAVLSTAGGVSHVVTHAFFKALLFLCCGAVMHGFGGQLDLRKLSGVMKMPGWRIVGVGMLVGCLNLAGFPFTAGFFSKDMILAEAFVTPGMATVGWILVLTAGLTAYYTFRVFFRVFMGPVQFEMGDEGHGSDDAHAADHGHDHGHDHGQSHRADHGHHDSHPHAPGWAINTVLAKLAILSIAAVGLFFIGGKHGAIASLVEHSTAQFASPFAHHEAGAGEHVAEAHVVLSVVPNSVSHPHEAHAGTIFGMDPHKAMYFVSGVVGALGIAVAFVLHFMGRTTAATAKADRLLPMLGPVPRWAQHKWYVDEFYEFLIRKPILVLAHIFHFIDRMFVDGLVNLAGILPRLTGNAIRPSQSGVLHGYALGMAGGIAIILAIVLAVAWN